MEEEMLLAAPAGSSAASTHKSRNRKLPDGVRSPYATDRPSKAGPSSTQTSKSKKVKRGEVEGPACAQAMKKRRGSSEADDFTRFF